MNRSTEDYRTMTDAIYDALCDRFTRSDGVTSHPAMVGYLGSWVVENCTDAQVAALIDEINSRRA